MDDFDLIGPLENSADSAAKKKALESRASRIATVVKSPSEEAPEYVASEALKTASNVALSLGKPLLVTGPPGCGKTQCGYWLAHVFDLGDPIHFIVKSTSQAKDLLYTFDAVSWFREKQISEDGKVERTRFIQPGPLGKAFGWEGAPTSPSVVILDEIDKAPRDFPNDLLHELDQMEFTVVDDDEERVVKCPTNMRPIVIVTSNRERQLPAPFLRRCVQHEIELGPEQVQIILGNKLNKMVGPEKGAFITAALSLWNSIHETPGSSVSIDIFWRNLALLAHGLSKAELHKLTEILPKKTTDFGNSISIKTIRDEVKSLV